MPSVRSDTLQITSYRVLIVSSGKKITEAFEHILSDPEHCQYKVVESIAGAQREILERPYDIAVINAPLPDNYGTSFAIDASTRNHMVTLLLVQNQDYDEITAKVSRHGVFTLAKPTTLSQLSQCMQWLFTAHNRMEKLEAKATNVEEKMKEIRIVNRAKWVLIEHLHMSEQEAHKFIEKQAMDRCVSKKSIAESIIQTYE